MVRRTILLGMLLFPGLAAGDDLELSLGASAEYDSNVFRSSRAEEDDVIFRIRPAASLVRTEGDLNYRLSYEMPFEQGIEHGADVSDFDQILSLNSTWIYDEANQFYLTNRFRHDRSLTRRFPAEDGTADISTRRDRVLSNLINLGMSHAFTRRTTGGLNFSHHLFETEERNRQDYQTFAVTGDINHMLSARNTIGTGVAFTAQGFQEAGGIPDSQTYYYNLFGTWVHRFDETTSFSISAGPTIIQLEEQDPDPSRTVATYPIGQSGGAIDFNSCPIFSPGVRLLDGCSELSPFTPAPVGSSTVQFAPGTAPPGQEDVRITIFGSARLQKRWTPDIATSLSYRRQQSGASGLGGSTILDAVAAEGEWQIDRWWNASLRADYAHRESVSDSTQTLLLVVDGAGNGNPGLAEASGLASTVIRDSIDTDNVGVSGRVSRQIGRRAEASLRLSYNRQLSAGGTRGRRSDYDVYLAIFGVRYRFEPITVW